MTRVIIATVGSVGDLLPMLAIGKALRKAGIEVTIAAHSSYREIVERHGLQSTAIGTHSDPMNIPLTAGQDDVISFIDHSNFAQLDRLFGEILDASAGADAIVAPYFVIPAHLVSEKLNVPFIACVLSPAHIFKLLNRKDFGAQTAAKTPRRWHMQLAELRRRTGLVRRPFPYTAILTSPIAILGTFPYFLCPEGPRGEGKIQVVGYPHLAEDRDTPGDEEAQDFCDEQTLLFSFGTHVDRYRPQYLYDESVAACRTVGLKCLYLSRFVQATARNTRRDPHVMLRGYINHDALLPRVGGVVHHGGLGTLMAACRHVRPMTIVPFRYDQPYHAERMAALINTPTVPIERYDRHALSDALRRMLEGAAAMRYSLKSIIAAERDGAISAAQEVIRAARFGH